MASLSSQNLSLLPQTLPGHFPITIRGWINSAESSSPSTWISSHKRSHNARNSEAEDAPVSSRTRKRTRGPPLGNISGNAMPQRGRSKKIDPPRRRSPRKNSDSESPSGPPPAASPPQRQVTLRSGQVLDSPNDEQTPRLQDPHSLTPLGATALPLPSYSDDRVPVADGRSDGEDLPRRPYTPSRSPTRSTSPVKVFKDLKFIKVPTSYEELDGEVARRLGGVLSNYRRLREIDLGANVIPGSLKRMIEAKVDQDDWPPTSAYTLTPSDLSDEVTEKYIEKMGEEAFRILEAARSCEKTRAEESEWNDDVHKPLLRLVVSNPIYSKGLKVVNITSAQIAPPELLATHSSGTVMQGKKVDYCLVLEPSDDMEKSITAQLEPLDPRFQSINQSMADNIRDRPIAVNMENKKPFCGDQSSDVQLAIWVGAGIERLRRMTTKKRPSRMPVFPALSIHGHDVDLLVFEDKGTKNVMYGKMRQGRTDTILGVFRVIATWELLANWAHKEYREWFGSYI